MKTFLITLCVGVLILCAGTIIYKEIKPRKRVEPVQVIEPTVQSAPIKVEKTKPPIVVVEPTKEELDAEPDFAVDRVSTYRIEAFESITGLVTKIVPYPNFTFVEVDFDGTVTGLLIINLRDKVKLQKSLRVRIVSIVREEEEFFKGLMTDFEYRESVKDNDLKAGYFYLFKLDKFIEERDKNKEEKPDLKSSF